MYISCPLKTNTLYKRLLEQQDGNKGNAIMAYNIITFLQDNNMLNTKAYKTPNGNFVYTVPKIINERSMANATKGKSGFITNPKAIQDLENYITRNNFSSFLEVINKENYSYIYLSKIPTKEQIENKEEISREFFLQDRALFEQEQREFLLDDKENFNKELAQKIQDKLQKLYPEIKLNITNNPIWEQGDNIFNQEEFNNQVNYRLKAAEKVLNNLTKIKQWESNKSIDTNTLWRKISELGIPKQQLELLKESEGNTVEKKLASFVANYSYAVEINTAKTKGLTNWRIIPGPGGEGANWAVEWANNQDGDLELFNTEQEARDFIKNKQTVNENTKHYSNLTVPGGTNYTENEIATPAITPSIKGHAQFATDKGIGWFRSDEQRLENPNNEPIKKLMDEGATFTEALRILGLKGGEDYIKTKTRRILEVQSDLFQKGRDSKLLTGEYSRFPIGAKVKYKNNIYTIDDKYDENIYKLYDLKNENDTIKGVKADEFTDIIESTSSNQFLQLLNKDNNWVTFFVKSIIQDSAKKGYEKVLFPLGETIAKIEQYGEAAKIYAQLLAKKQRGEKLTVQEENAAKEYEELNQKSVVDFYEVTVTNILKKQGYNPVLITDEYGNTWNEISINQARDLADVMLQRNEANQIIGQANIKAMTVLIDAVNQKQDTLPHEYAHHYIAWFRDTPIVQEAIKKWGSEEALVQSIGEQVVKQKGESYGWWKNFVTWILDKFKTLSLIDKQGFTEILTSAFLERADLSIYKPSMYSESIDVNNKSLDIAEIRKNVEKNKSNKPNLGQLNLFDDQFSKVEEVGESEKIEITTAKISTLKKAFPNVEILYGNEFVEFAPNEAGVLLSSSHPLTKQYGKRVIVLNPGIINSDTVIHEFGHLYIDMLGGLSNTRIKNAVSKLEGTELWNKVAESYPELNPEMLAKEVLATAIGIEGSEIFDNEINATWWNRLVEWFFGLLEKNFGVKQDTAKSLAKEMLNNNLDSTINFDAVSEIDQFGRFNKSKFVTNKIVENKIKNLEDVRNLAIKSFDSKTERMKHFKYSEFAKEFVKLKDEVEKIEKGSEELSILNIVNFALTNYNNQIAILNEKAYGKEIEGKEYKKGELLENFATDENFKRMLLEGINEEEAKNLEKLYDVLYYSNLYLGVYDFIKKIYNAQSSGAIDLKSEPLKKALNEFLENKNKFEIIRLDILKKLNAFYAAQESLLIESDVKQEFQKEFRNANMGRKQDAAYRNERDEYVNKQFEANLPEIISDNYERWLQEFSQGVDIGGVGAMMLNQTNIKSFTIQLLKRMADKRDFEKAVYLQNIQPEITALFNEFKSELGVSSITNPEAAFSKFLEKDKDGNNTGYLADEFLSEFYSEYKKILDERNAADIALDHYAALHPNEDIVKKNQTYYDLNKKVKQLQVNLSILEESQSPDINEIIELSKEIDELKYKRNKVYNSLANYFKNNKFDETKESHRVLKNFIEAQNNYNKWKSENTVRIKNPDTESKYKVLLKPASKWKNTDYANLSSSEKEILTKLKELFKKTDELKPFRNRLVKRAYGDTYFYELPTADKTTLERIMSSSFFDGLKETFTDLYKEKATDVELRGKSTDSKITGEKLIQTDDSNRPFYKIPNLYRGPKTSDQSYDLFSLLMLEFDNSLNQHLSKDLLVQVELMRDVILDKKFYEVDKYGSVLKGKHTLKEIQKAAVDTNEYALFKSIVEQRLYGLNMYDSDFNKPISTVMKFASMSMFAFNYFAGIPNVIVGKTNAAIDSVAFMKTRGWDPTLGDKLYKKNWNTIVPDIGKVQKTSLVNLLLQRYSVISDYKGLHTKYLYDTRFKSVAHGAAYSISNVGEHYVQSVQMLTILGNTKVKNDKRQWIDKNGNVVDTREEAASLYDMYSTDGDGKIKVSDLVKYTELSLKPFEEIHVRNYLKKMVSDAQGQYDSDQKARFQRYGVGLATSMFRKWVEPGVMRRFRGIDTAIVTRNMTEEELQNSMVSPFVSLDKNEEMEGMYTTLFSFINQLIKNYKHHKKVALSESWDNLSDMKKENLYRSAIDMSVMLATFASYYALRALAGGSFDDDDKDKILFAAYIARRTYAELRFYSSPPEFYKLMKSPAAPFSYLENTYKFTTGAIGTFVPLVDNKTFIFDDNTETYEVLKKRFIKISPMAQFFRNTKDALVFIEN